MEINQDIIIVGGGVAGLTTALGLHRLGIKCLVLESSENLRATGFAFQTWSNAWIALDALGIGATLRPNHQQLMSCVVSSTVTGLPISETPFVGKGKHGDIEVRCLRRKELLLELAKDLPRGTVKFCSKVLSITEEKHRKLVHLVDGTIIKAKVLIGCDGVNSVVAKWLGLGPSSFTGRWAIRGFAKYPDGHKFEPKLLHFFGNGIRYGVPLFGNVYLKFWLPVQCLSSFESIELPSWDLVFPLSIVILFSLVQHNTELFRADHVRIPITSLMCLHDIMNINFYLFCIEFTLEVKHISSEYQNRCLNKILHRYMT